MEIRELVKKYLGQAMVMQLATVNDGRPWICTVHYAFDDDFNMYWVSLTSRRHSADLEKDSSAATAVVVKAPKHPVIGIQMSGQAGLVEDDEELKKAAGLYAGRHRPAKEFVDGVLSKQAPFRLYRFKPDFGVLFDEVDFPDNPRQEWTKE